MKYLIVILTWASASSAIADPGHLIGVAGHDHWLAGAAIGAAIAAGIWGALKGKPEEKSDAEDEAADDRQEA